MMPSVAFVFSVTGVLFLSGFVLFGRQLYRTQAVARGAPLVTMAGTVVFLEAMTVLIVAGCVPVRATWAADTAPVRSEKPQAGIRLDVFELRHGGEFVQEVWIYRPDPLPKKRIPIVLVPPAGGNLFTAPTLGVGDQPEHVPYVEAGFAVVSFAMRGEVADHASEWETIAAALAFRSGRAGVDDARLALDLALSVLPTVDRKAVFAAGHSSAATLVLLLAAIDDRIRGVAAYAPVWDVPGFLGQELVLALDAISPGYAEFLEWSSPDSHMRDLDVPLMLFHAEDDGVVPYESALTSMRRARAAGVELEFHSVESGGHYDSMITMGIPAAIRWMHERRSP
ncbi:MAG: prolyl oligopeptidase family serine peptidase [Rhodothermales bacterium]|nr:prolyl oligopeptidase family serine peptidase [Rhodothermales bacterium]